MYLWMYSKLVNLKIVNLIGIAKILLKQDENTGNAFYYI